MSDDELANPSTEYSQLIDRIGNTLNEARNNLAQAVNSVMVDAYWQVGQQIIEFEQKGYLNDTFVMFVSDHGLHFPRVIGVLAFDNYDFERMLPSLFIISGKINIYR